MLRRIIFTVFLLITYHFLLITYVYAADEFTTSYDVVYDVGLDGITTVTEKISLRNLTSEYYASEFKLIIGATQISDIRASDEGGNMEVKKEQSGTSTTIAVKFNQQVVGKDKILPWTLQFKSRDFAERIGKVWEVRTPKTSSENLEGYNLTISVPLQFGEPTLISPTPKTQTQSGGKMFLTFDKSQLQQSGVSASFGTTQLFDFDLAYHLINTNLVPILTNIALPPDTSYQDVIFQRIEPKPLNVTVDDDGNYLAWYRLNRGQKIDVRVAGSAKLYTSTKVKNPALSESLRQKYTKANKYWEKDNPQIQTKLSEILDKSEESSEKIKLIYRYVVNSLKYDSSRLKGIRIDRLGAVTALNNPTQAVCMEFTDLFIALARAAGIPARELNGYAYTANPALRPLSLTRDILHAWPEYFDEAKGWIMVDPTWENTTGGVDYFNKLDLSHFVFAIKGSASEYPIPAGSYKSKSSEVDEQNARDVKVELSDDDFLGKPQLDVQIDTSNPIFAGFPGKIKIKVSNVGNGAYLSNTFRVEAGKLKILEGGSQTLGPVPPFGNASFSFNLRTGSLFDEFNDQIVVSVGSQKFTKEVMVKPFLLFRTMPLIAIGVVSLMGLLYLVVLTVLIYRRRFKTLK